MSKASALVMGVGPSQGLGATLCRKFAREGLFVYVCGRSKQKLEDVCTEINEEGYDATPIVADLTDKNDIDQMTEIIVENKSIIELAVYNAGNNRMESFLDMKPEIFEGMWRILCYGAFLSSQSILRLMLDQKEDASKQSIFYTGASGSVRGKAMFSSFASGKGAMRLMCQSIAKEFGPKGIHIAHFIIDGVINGDKVVKGFPEFAEKLGEEGMLNLDAIAQTYWSIHQQDKSAWTHEVDLRPNIESF